jgi:hypothetical protein
MKLGTLVAARSGLDLATTIQMDGLKAYKIGKEVDRLKKELSLFDGIRIAAIKATGKDELAPGTPEHEAVIKKLSEASEAEIEDVTVRITEADLETGLAGVRCAKYHIDAMLAVFGEPKSEEK